MHSFPDSHFIMDHNFVVLQLSVGPWSHSNIDIRKINYGPDVCGKKYIQKIINCEIL